MSIPSLSPTHIDLESWVLEVKADPVRHRERQVAHILLFAVGRTPVLRDNLLLKGGTLLSTAYQSARQTGDVDFTAVVPAEPYASQIREILDKALRLALEDLGYNELVLQVQKIKLQPSKEMFATAVAPALKITIGSAKRGTNEEQNLTRGQAAQVLHIDLSFSEPVLNVQALTLNQEGITIKAYGIEDIIAEKLRALIQQPIRKRNRRQDIYDIHWLLETKSIDLKQKESILKGLVAKSGARDIIPSKGSLDNSEVKDRAKQDWQSMVLEVGELPDFELAYNIVRDFYVSLPWAEK